MTDEDWEPFAFGGFKCTECEEIVPVPVLARTIHEDGDMFLETRADMSDVWSHAWTHDPAAN